MAVQVRTHTDPPTSDRAVNVIMVGDITPTECRRLPELLSLRYRALRTRQQLTLVSVPSTVFKLYEDSLPGLLGHDSWSSLRAERRYAWQQRNTATLQAARTVLLEQLLPALAVIMRQHAPHRSTDHEQVDHSLKNRRHDQQVINALIEHNPNLCVIELNTTGHPVRRANTQPVRSRRTDRAQSS